MHVSTEHSIRGFSHFCGEGEEKSISERRRKALLWQIAHEVHQGKIYIFPFKIVNTEQGRESEQQQQEKALVEIKYTESHKSFPTLENFHSLFLRFSTSEGREEEQQQ